MQKTYLRYAPQSILGVVASARAPIHLFSASSSSSSSPATATTVLFPSWDSAVLWDFAKAAMLGTYLPRKDKVDGEVTALCSFGDVVVLGRFTGRVDVYNEFGPPRASLSRHRSAVTCVRFNQDGSRFASGALDTSILIMDTSSDSVLFALRGHKDQVTDLVFVGDNSLMSSSKDSLIKVWDLDAQVCFQTIASHKTGVWALDLDSASGRVATGSSDGLIQLLAKDSISQLWQTLPGPVGRQTT